MDSFGRRSAWVVLVGVLLVFPAAVFAQDAPLSGTVADATGGVLPGVTITALHEASGNSVETVTDGLGSYRIPARVGTYRLTAALGGFATVTRTGVALLLGQSAVVNIEMVPSTVQESVTVTGEAPLISTTTSSLSGNIDPKQMQELPLNGRNFMDLTLLAAGARQNAAGETPLPQAGMWQLNLDGQQVTQLLAGAQQPHYSRDAIAEFEFVSNRFDATQGRSAGVQVNAITKAGSNTAAGTFSGYFRSDTLNAADFIQDRVVPYSNQQFSATFGGPIRRDRVHFFGNYEYEREPQTVTYDSPYPAFNIDLEGKRTEQKGGARADFQLGQTHLMLRGTGYRQFIQFLVGGGATIHPSAASHATRRSTQGFVQLTQVLSNRAVNEIKGGYNKYWWTNENYVVSDGKHDLSSFTAGTRIPRIVLRGYQLGAQTNSPQNIEWSTMQVRDDFTFSYTAAGRHDLKAGGEYVRTFSRLLWCSFCNGRLDANNGPAPRNLEQLIPVWNEPKTWNLNALAPLSVRWRQSVGDFNLSNPRYIYGAWLQDNWQLSQRLTLNLGLRYDLDWGGIGEHERLLPWMSGERPSDTNNWGPRTGFAYRLSEATVLRGGYGIYYTQLENDPVHQPRLFQQIIIPEVTNDGRADFPTNPFNGPKPSYEQAVARRCSVRNVPGCIRADITSKIPSPYYRVSYSHQASVGVQRQLGEAMAFESNYVYNGSRADEVTRNMNLTYDPATGANYSASDISRRPFPDWGFVNGEWMVGRSNYHGWESSLTRRFRDNWQASATYTLGKLSDDEGPVCEVFRDGGGLADCRPVTFQIAPDISDYTLAATDQRHRAVFNGIWDMGMGFQVSGLYFFGSGMRYATTFPSDVRNTGSGTAGRLRPDGTIVPRNSRVGDPVHRVDLRLQRRFGLGGNRSLDGMLEAFNLFNHENYGSYVGDVTNANFGMPTFNANVAYAPRMVQLGFRVAF